MKQRVVGFTLIELLVVMALLGASLAYAIPSLGEWIANSRSGRAADTFETALSLIKAEAGRTGVVVQLVVTDDPVGTLNPAASTTGLNLIVRRMTRADPAVADAVVIGYQLVPAATGTASPLVNSTQAVLGFNPFGRLVDGNPQTYTFIAGGATRGVTLTVGVSGNTTRCEFASSYYDENSGAIDGASGC